jgi:hypothetical protein
VKILHFDCTAGISGDMTVAALLDLGVPLDYLEVELRKLGLPEGSWSISLERDSRKGITAARILVEAPDHHSHRHFSHIRSMIADAPLTQRARELALAIFSRLAEAEAEVHGTTVDDVHFHEVGAMDSIIDIVGAAICIDYLGVEAFTTAPLPLGGGFVQTAHGLLPVPAPATALLLRGLPVHSSLGEGERVTPTGAAIVATLCQGSAPPPAMTVQRVGWGAGTKDFPDIANILRLLLGETESPLDRDSVEVLETNIDDMNPEILAHVAGRLLEQGALDVSIAPLIMKKGRPGFLLTVLTSTAERDVLARFILQETTAAGVRSHTAARMVLSRTILERTTSLGPVQVKSFSTVDGSCRIVPEYEECRRLAAEHNLPLQEVYAIVEQEACRS